MIYLTKIRRIPLLSVRLSRFFHLSTQLFHLSSALIFQTRMTLINQEKNPRHPRLKNENFKDVFVRMLTMKEPHQ